MIRRIFATIITFSIYTSLLVYCLYAWILVFRGLRWLARAIFLALFLASLNTSATAATIGLVERWDIETTRAAGHDFNIWRDEYLSIEPRFLSFDEAINFSNVTGVAMEYRSSDMETGQYYAITGAVSDVAGGRVAIPWTPAAEADATVYSYRIDVSATGGRVRRGFGKITLKGDVPSSITNPPVMNGGVLDWAVIQNTNTTDAPFQLKAAALDIWASITPSANVQSLVSAADYAAIRELLDLEEGIDFYSIAAADLAFEPLDPAITKSDEPETITANWTNTVNPWAVDEGGTGAGTASGARIGLGVAIGSDVQAWDADLDALALNDGGALTNLAVTHAQTTGQEENDHSTLGNAITNGTGSGATVTVTYNVSGIDGTASFTDGSMTLDFDVSLPATRLLSPEGGLLAKGTIVLGEGLDPVSIDGSTADYKSADREHDFSGDTITNASFAGDGSALTGTVVHTDQSNAYSSGLQDFSGASIKVKQPEFAGDSVPTWTNRTIVFDTAKDNFIAYNSRSNTSHDLGYEGRAHMCNTSGGTIADLTPVYISGTTNGCKVLSVASSESWNTSRIIGVMTEAIPNGETGEVTIWGDASGDTLALGLSVGVIYLGDGVLTSTRSTGGSFAVLVGYCASSATNGLIFIQPQVPELAVEVTDTNGFPPDQRTGTSLTFTNANRTAVIAPTGTAFHYYDDGLQYKKTSAESVVISDVEGLHVGYFEGTNFNTIANPNSGQVSELIRTAALVFYVYWDSTNDTAVYFADERHGMNMSPVTHSYLHFTQSAKWLQGGSLANIDADGSGNDDSSAKFSVSFGIFADEDIIHSPGDVSTNDTLYVYYLDGASAELRRATNSVSWANVLNAPAGRLYYNQFTGGAWQLTEVANNNFVHYHTIWVNSVEGQSPIVLQVMGQDIYGTANSARNGLSDEIATILSMFPQEELILLGTVLYQTSDGYANAVKARIRTNADGEDYTSWVTTEIGQGTPPASHANLTDITVNDHSTKGNSRTFGTGAGATVTETYDVSGIDGTASFTDGSMTLDFDVSLPSTRLLSPEGGLLAKGTIGLGEGVDPVSIDGSTADYSSASGGHNFTGDAVTNLIAVGMVTNAVIVQPTVDGDTQTSTVDIGIETLEYKVTLHDSIFYTNYSILRP